MLSLKVSKQTRTEASKNKVIIKSIKHINRISKSKQIINQTSFRILRITTLQKIHGI